MRKDGVVLETRGLSMRRGRDGGDARVSAAVVAQAWRDDG